MTVKTLSGDETRYTTHSVPKISLTERTTQTIQCVQVSKSDWDTIDHTDLKLDAEDLPLTSTSMHALVPGDVVALQVNRTMRTYPYRVRSINAKDDDEEIAQTVSLEPLYPNSKAVRLVNEYAACRVKYDRYDGDVIDSNGAVFRVPSNMVADALDTTLDDLAAD